jgi:hypothetical protein
MHRGTLGGIGILMKVDSVYISSEWYIAQDECSPLMSALGKAIHLRLRQDLHPQMCLYSSVSHAFPAVVRSNG